MLDARTVLGVTADASQDEIRRAWRRLALQSHPDKHPGDAGAAARFREATDAYRALAHGAVEIRSYKQLCEEMDDVRHALQRAIQLASNGPPPAAASTAGENKDVTKTMK